MLGHYLFEYSPRECEQLDVRLAEDYAKILKECKTVEKHLREREKDLLNIEGFATVSLFTGEKSDDAVDGNKEAEKPREKTTSVDESTSDTFSDEIGIEISTDNLAEDNAENIADENHKCSNEIATTELEEKPEWNRRTLISSLIETKANLREIVDTASQRGAEAWKNLLKKSGNRRRRTESEPTSPPSDLGSVMSFDLEIACNTCGKKIIESRQRVLDGGLNDQSMDKLECLMCSKARERDQGSPEKWTLRYPKVFRQRSKTETNPETGESFLDRGTDHVDSPNFFVINGENVDNRKTSSAAIESMYGVSTVLNTPLLYRLLYFIILVSIRFYRYCYVV